MLDWVAAGSLQLPTIELLPLDQAERAHRLLEERGRVSNIVMVP